MRDFLKTFLTAPVRSVLVCGVLIVLLGKIPVARAVDSGRFIQGTFSGEYSFEMTDNASDHDWEAFATLNFGDPSQDRFTGALRGGGIFDLDGDGADYFSDVYNTFSGSSVGRLYYAYFDINQTRPLELVRAGRQHIYGPDTLYFDGLSFETLPYAGFTFSGFGGIPVHQFENMLGIDAGDYTAGAALQWRPINTLKFKIDYTYLNDELTGFRVAAGDQSDSLIGASAWIDASQCVQFASRFTAFSDEVRDLDLTATFKIPKYDFKFRVNGFRLFNGYDVRVIEWDAFGVAGTYVPYTQVSFTASKGILDQFFVDTGFMVRSLDDSQTASAFNHGFKRYFLSFSSEDLFFKDFSLSSTFDYYNGDDNTLKNNNTGVSFDAKKRYLDDRFVLNAGTGYYLYKYNLNTGDESDGVQVLYAGTDWNFYKGFSTKMRYEFENNDTDDFHTFTAGMIWDF